MVEPSALDREPILPTLMNSLDDQLRIDLPTP